MPSLFDVEFDVTKIETGVEGLRVDSKYVPGCNWMVLKQDLLYNPIRNLMIAEVVDERLEQGWKPMIMCTEVDHLLLLEELLFSRGVNVSVLYGDMTNYNDADVLIGSAKKCGRGFDEKMFCKNWGGKHIDCIMIVDYVANSATLTQWIGRGFRVPRGERARVDHFVDNDSSVEKQWTKCLDVYTWMGAPIEDMYFEPADFIEEASNNVILKEFLESRDIRQQEKKVERTEKYKKTIYTRGYNNHKQSVQPQKITLPSAANTKYVYKQQPIKEGTVIATKKITSPNFKAMNESDPLAPLKKVIRK